MDWAFVLSSLVSALDEPSVLLGFYRRCDRTNIIWRWLKSFDNQG